MTICEHTSHGRGSEPPYPWTDDQAYVMLGRLTHGVLHDSANLLMIVDECIEQIRQGMPPTTPVLQHLDALDAIIDHTQRMYRQLQAMAYGRQFSPEALDLRTYLPNLCALIQRFIGASVMIVSDISPDLTLLALDPTDIDRLLINLALNAAAAMPQGGSLTVAARNSPAQADADGDQYREPLPQGILLTVHDTGVGIPTDIQPQIFMPFFTTKKNTSSSGIGLSICASIIQRYGGSISCTSQLGSGTTFSIFFPTALPAARGAPQAPIE